MFWEGNKVSENRFLPMDDAAVLDLPNIAALVANSVPKRVYHTAAIVALSPSETDGLIDEQTSLKILNDDKECYEFLLKATWRFMR